MKNVKIKLIAPNESRRRHRQHGALLTATLCCRATRVFARNESLWIFIASRYGESSRSTLITSFREGEEGGARRRERVWSRGARRGEGGQANIDRPLLPHHCSFLFLPSLAFARGKEEKRGVPGIFGVLSFFLWPFVGSVHLKLCER